MSDELRDRLGRLDPMGPEVDTRPAYQAREMLEKAMSTQSTTIRSPFPRIVAVAAVLALAVTGVMFLGGTDPATPPLALSAGESDVMASCLPFSVEILADMEVAFEGKVTDVQGETVTLDVTRWFTGGEAEQVTITAPAGMEALIGGIPFVVDGDYLVTATNGVVNYCGFTAEATPDMRAAFEEAFPTAP